MNKRGLFLEKMLCIVMILCMLALNIFVDFRSYAAENESLMPTIADGAGAITDNQRELLLNKFAEVFPDTDLSMYTLSYSEEKSKVQKDYTRICFDVYYNGMYVYDGFEFGDVSENSIVCIGNYNGVDFESVFSEDFYKNCLELNFSNMLSTDDIKQGLIDDAYISSDESIEIEPVIYNYLTDRLGSDTLKIAYKAKLIRDEETIIFIIDALTNEVILQDSGVVYDTSNNSSSYTYSKPEFELKCTIIDDEVTIDEINVIQGAELEIPDTINGCPVIAVADNAFMYSQMSLDKITIPENVISVGNYAFVGQHGAIETVIFPESIESVGEYAAGYIQNGINYTLDERTVIYGYANTAAETYAKNNDLTFIAISDDAIYGDVNGDGSFGVSDVVLFQKWLLAVPDTTLENWKAADFCKDGVLNVFDLCLMKRALIQQQN